MRLGATGSDQCKQRIGIIAAIGDDMAALKTFEEVWRGAKIVCLASRQHQPYGKTALINEDVYLGAQSATRTADGVIFAPFLPPAACWWARMMELSMNAIEWGDFAASLSKIPTQIPALAQRLKRL